jgi:alanine racemase
VSRVRPAWAAVDLGAVRHNTEVLAAAAAPARLCAVVKADGYGHGAVPVAKAALEAGASWLAVALPAEGAVLREAGIDARVLVLSEPSAAEMATVVEHDLCPTVSSDAGIDALAKAVRAAGRSSLPVHLKVDTGMHRAGASLDDVGRLAQRIAGDESLELEALWTHCAVADEPGNDLTDRQKDRFEQAIATLDGLGLRPPLLHMANSAAALVRPDLRYDLVRCGIALYGIAPSCALAAAGFTEGLRPVLSLKAKVSSVRVVPEGDGVSYGWHRPLPRRTVVATVPIGYADGVPRRLSIVGGQVLLGGRRRDLAGVVTMDQLMIDCGDDDVAVGDEVVLIGAQGDERITAEELAGLLGTIGYEVVCGIGPRVPRLHR